ncbi:MAG: Ig-like domain-containing protein, partial [Bacteroidales bacterium]|nr:Ig-like domain-containing protein [Bacteroidales bacterium]
MKRFFAISGLVMAAIAALSGCNKEIDVQVSEDNFSVVASLDANTKTTNSGMSTFWAENDAITVFYSEAAGSYTSAGKFTLSDGAGSKLGTFTTSTAPELTGSKYDWYAIYPSGVKSPASADADGGYTYVGDTRGLKQSEYASKNALCGSACPMYAVTKGVSKSATPSFAFKQIASVIEVNVVNKTGKSLVVTSVELDETESGQDIVGSYYIDFTGNEPVFTGSEGYVKTVSGANITSPAELGAADTAKVYLVVRPYAHDASKAFTLNIAGSVDGKAGNAVVKLYPTAAQGVFSAGKIKKVTANVTSMELANVSSVTDAVAAQDNDDVVVENAIVAALTSRGFVITDGSSNVYVYQNSAPTVALGDKVRVTAKKTTYYGLPELTSPSVTVISSGNSIPRTKLIDITGSIDSYSSSTADYVTVTGPLTKSGSTYVVTPEGAQTFKASASNPHSSIDLASAVEKNVTMTGYFNTIHNGNKYVQIIVTDLQVNEQPGPGPDPVFNGTTVTVNMKEYFDSHGYATGTVYANIDLSSAVRMSTTGNPNCGAFFSSGDDWRLYQNQNGNVIISVAKGCTLYSVKFTYGTSNGGALFDSSNNKLESDAEFETGGTSVEFTVGNTGDATNGQVRIKEVEVKYTGSGTLDPSSGPTETETKITLANNKSVYIGETVELGATVNVNATITYESEDAGIATVDANGVVTGVSAGQVKVYARVAANPGVYTADERYCNVTVSEKPVAQTGTWKATALSQIADGAEFVLVSNVDGSYYAISNDKSTSAAPSAVAVSVSGQNLASAPASNLVWKMKKVSGGYNFLKGDDTEKWLYTTKSNNGLRVGTGE